MVCMRNKSDCGHLQAPANDADSLAAGSVLLDRYLIGMALGSGGFGVTYIAWDFQDARRLAIKEFFPRDIAYRRESTSNIVPRSNWNGIYRDSLLKFMDEAVRLHGFNHPGIVQVLNYFEANGTAYLVMPYIEGIQLEAYLRNQRGQRIGEAEALRIAEQVLDTLEVVHGAGLIHRDIKPENLYLKEHDTSRVMLLDFGSARKVDSGLTVFVTHGYAPPEQYSESAAQGPYTDIYGLSATLYRCVTGVIPPKAGERQTAESGDPLKPVTQYAYVTPGFEAAVMQGLRLQRGDRPQNANEMRRLFSCLPGRGRDSLSAGMQPAIGQGPTPWQRFLSWLSGAGPVGRLPRASAHGTLIGLAGEYKDARVPLDGPVIVGRDLNACNLVFSQNEHSVSRQHLRVEYDPGMRLFRIMDLDSKNGTYLLKAGVGILRIDPRMEIFVQDGTEFYLGSPDRALFRVEEQDNEV